MQAAGTMVVVQPVPIVDAAQDAVGVVGAVVDAVPAPRALLRRRSNDCSGWPGEGATCFARASL